MSKDCLAKEQLFVEKEGVQHGDTGLVGSFKELWQILGQIEIDNDRCRM